METSLRSAGLAALAVALISPNASAQEPVQVVTSLSSYAAIAREIVGERGHVESIARGDENPHFVKPKPSYVVMLRDADLFVTTGLDLELWVPTLLDKAANRQIQEGGAGYVTAYTGVRLLEIPASASRAAGDIHLFGNPHIHTDPINAIVISRNILTGLKRVSPDNYEYFAERQAEFERRVLRALVGEQLIEILGEDVLFELANSEGWWEFIYSTEYEGRPLADYLGGWLAKGKPFRGREMVCYHKQWIYFSTRFDITCAGFVESKPGIPPSPRHVQTILEMMASRRIPALFAANFWDDRQVKTIAARVGATPIIVPEHAGGEEGVDSYFELVDAWVSRLAETFAGAGDAAGR